MSQKLISVASQLYCSPVFQHHVRSASYQQEKFVRVAIAASENFLKVLDEMEFTGNPMVALSYYANRIGEGMTVFNDHQMQQLAKLALETSVEFDRVMALHLGETPKTQVKKSEPKPEAGEVDLPIEQCGLTAPVIEKLLAGGYTTTLAVLNADTQGKIADLVGSKQARNMIMSQIRDAMKAAVAASAEGNASTES